MNLNNQIESFEYTKKENGINIWFACPMNISCGEIFCKVILKQSIYERRI